MIVCAHEKIAEIRCEKGPHHAKRVCATCGKFQGWARKPETIAANGAVEKKCLDLWDAPLLTDWEREFVRSIADDPKKLSPKQRTKLELLWSEHRPQGGS